MLFRALAPGVEVSGAAVLSVVEELADLRKVGLRILASHGIDDPVPDGWYPQQCWLDAFEEIATKTGPATLRAIGRRIPDTARWPAEVDSVAAALASIDVAYHMNHRGGEIGHYLFEKLGPTSATVECTDPYPCDFDMGIVEQTALKFAPPGSRPSLRHDHSLPCRQQGGRRCLYLVNW